MWLIVWFWLYIQLFSSFGKVKHYFFLLKLLHNKMRNMRSAHLNFIQPPLALNFKCIILFELLPSLNIRVVFFHSMRPLPYECWWKKRKKKCFVPINHSKNNNCYYIISRIKTNDTLTTRNKRWFEWLQTINVQRLNFSFHFANSCTWLAMLHSLNENQT